MIEEYQTKGQAGGGAAAATWNQKGTPLRVVSKSDDLDVQIVSGEIRIATPGTYLVVGKTPAISVNAFRGLLRDPYSPTINLYGSTGYSLAGDYAQDHSFFNGTITVPPGRTGRFNLFVYTTAARATYGLGSANNINDIDGNALEEKFSELLFIKIA